MSPASEPAFHYEQLANGWEVGRFAALDALPGVTHLVTTRRGPDVGRIKDDLGESAADEIAAHLGLRQIAWGRQVHGPDVLSVHSGGLAGECDGLATSERGLGLMMRSADCPLVLVADAGGRAIGAAHASWRSTVQQIAARLVEVMAGRFGADPGNLVACICPSAGPCCYEVGQDVREAMLASMGSAAECFLIRRGGKMHLDLWAANAEQLRLGGVLEENIHISGQCTLCNNDRFPSHRREGATAGRFVAVVARR